MTDLTALPAEQTASAADTAQPEAKTEVKDDAAPKTEKAPEKSPEQALDDDLRKTFRRVSKGRDEGGKFAPKGEKSAEPGQQLDLEDAVKTAEKKAPEVKAPEVKAEAPKPAVEPPKSWKPEFREKWANVPAEVQQYIQQRETEAGTEIQKLSGFTKSIAPVAQTLQQFGDYIQGVGKPAHQFVGELLAASRALDTNPAETIKALAQAYNVDLTQLADPFAPAPDPQVNALQQKISELERRLAADDNRRAAQQRYEAESRASEADRLVQEFIADKEDVNLVTREFEAQIRAIRAANPNLDSKQVLQEAYDRAIWANPDTRTRLIQRQQQEAEAKRVEEAKRAANGARAASAINVSGAPQSAAPSNDLDADLRQIWRKQRAV